MPEKVGRNDPCPCGSQKKYKSCCLLKDLPHGTAMGKRKFTAKVLSSGGANKQVQQQPAQDQSQVKAAVDYATLMERSFGQALHTHDEKPPLPANPSLYLSQDKPQEQSE